MRERRLQFAGENAHRPPFVLKGDAISAATFWHGKEMDTWAVDWVRYQTDGRAQYVTTAMEDSGTLEALEQLAKADRVDAQRVMVLRTASNFDQQRLGISAAQSLAETKIAHYSAYLPSLEAAYRVGDAVARELITHWSKYEDEIPR
jgi:purine nucleoside permease